MQCRFLSGSRRAVRDRAENMGAGLSRLALDFLNCLRRRDRFRTWTLAPLDGGGSMDTLDAISDLPNGPAVYALCGGKNRGRHLAYVGIADDLKRRIIQHLVSRKSSVATGTSALGLNPDYVTELSWWESTEFNRRSALEAAELIAFEVLKPVLRSRGAIRGEAKKLYEDKEFASNIRNLFHSEPTGRLILTSLPELVVEVGELKKRVQILESRLAGMAR
jgi:hypothetical protein